MQRVGDVESAADTRSTVGQPRRCHAKFSTDTGMRRSIASTEPRSSGGCSRSFQELEKMVISSARLPSDRGKCRARAAHDLMAVLANAAAPRERAAR